ncbi:aminotransferase class I/II-fold pyridoxal phosphate-dependent enzyme [Xanthovirga aplysinae]|uniref:aminotransferase class I/II-fold pyridoxal phosphate-dependent enzyme n=1 Tax=Xanthovirga aplysinae TaxID=2529853 RepID=UPI0012BD3442|nr:aminotransferase class I/II-fold pyridoxal phosphate-dependent enzyme [Xanthovirga aplysinae]MTI31595.1 aminotransferase class I/II-fold pyridoxal phosphate-dependent enzyme [Xanthovirga aplysinae]
MQTVKRFCKGLPWTTVSLERFGKGKGIFEGRLNPPFLEEKKHFYSLEQFREETWKYIQNSTHLLIKENKRTEERKQIVLCLHEALKVVLAIEKYFTFPGKQNINILKDLLKRKEYRVFHSAVHLILRLLNREIYRTNPLVLEQNILSLLARKEDLKTKSSLKYFEVLFVDSMPMEDEEEARQMIREIMKDEKEFFYSPVFVDNFEDAFIAAYLNPNIQSCVIRYGITAHGEKKSEQINGFLSDEAYLKEVLSNKSERRRRIFSSLLNLTAFSEELKDFFHKSLLKRGNKSPEFLGEQLKHLRPELDIFYITDAEMTVDRLNTVTLKLFNRVFYEQEELIDMHLSILKSVKARYEAPFFDALVKYSQNPVGVFHALPISRGNSLFNSHWARDMADFYGENIFLAETSSTCGGLDSLLEPRGPLKKAQEAAARAFGSEHCYFVTNGTSTSNKIVFQALTAPGDIVLIDRNCHKSHHYALFISGVEVVYLDAYPISEYTIYGGVPIQEIKKQLLDLKQDGRLDKVKMLVLTNCTFDGITYNVERLMKEVLAIKPDMIFFWDEAWFGYARFNETFRKRTAMYAAQKLQKLYHSPEYRTLYQEYLAFREKKKNQSLSEMVNPEKVKIRVYATHSTHKTLSSLRQGSMINIFDEEYEKQVIDLFQEAYMTHTSTSPNYQIVASLDIARRQAELEGYEMVGRSVKMANLLREKVLTHPLLKKYFSILKNDEMIPEKFRSSVSTTPLEERIIPYFRDEAWGRDEFVLDPTKITLHIGKTGLNGDSFKQDYLMDKFGIQVNKTSKNTVLLMTNIGTSKSSVAYLVSVLLKIAESLENEKVAASQAELQLINKKVEKLTLNLPALPAFSGFHQAFQFQQGSKGGLLRKAYYLAFREENCEYVEMENCQQMLKKGREIVSTAFVTPYPPGFPILVPGQLITLAILKFMKELEGHEIHNFRPELGFKVFKEEVLKEIQKPTARKRGKTIPLKRKITEKPLGKSVSLRKKRA